MEQVPKQVKSFKEKIGTIGFWSDPTIDRPSREDFKQKRIAIREDIIKRILDEILKKGHFCIITGPGDYGKTWLCSALAFELERRRSPFYFIDVDDEFDADIVWNYIRRFERAHYWIVEDCRNNQSEVDDFLQNILQSGLKRFKFIFTIRKPTKLTPVDGRFYHLSVKEKCEIPLGEVDEESTKHVEAIIRRFIKTEKVEKYVKVTDEEIRSIAEKWGANLCGVSLRLKLGWHFKKGVKLSKVRDTHVYDYMNKKLKLERPGRQKIFLYLSALCQFEPLMVSTVFLHAIDSETVVELERERQIERKQWRGKDFFSIREGTAKWILRTLSYKRNPQFVDDKVKKAFEEYVKSNPPNWMYVFYDLHLAAGECYLAKEILTSLLHNSEVWEIVKELGVQSSLVEVFPLLQAIPSMDPQQKYIQDFWSYYIQCTGINFLKNEIYNLKAKTRRLYQLYNLIPIDELKMEILSNLNKRFRSSTAHKINSELASLHKAWKLDFTYFFGAFSTLDWINVINRSTLRSIRTLFGNFIEHRKLVNVPFMERFAEALVDERVDWDRLITQKSISLYRLNGLIQFVEKVTPEYAKKLIERLSKLDLNDMFSRHVDPEARKKGKSKAEIVNNFHTQICKLSVPHHWNRIMNKVNDKTWTSITFFSDLEHNLWLLWNIYRHNQQRARQLAIANERFIREDILKVRFPPVMLLTALGILHLCRIDIQKIEIGEIDIEEIKRILGELKNRKRPPCTQIVLSLIALKVKLSLNQFQSFREILKGPRMIECIYNNEDFQLGKVLRKLVEQL